MVRAPYPEKMVHCYLTRTLEVTQYATQMGAREKAVATIKFPGELISTLVK